MLRLRKYLFAISAILGVLIVIFSVFYARHIHINTLKSSARSYSGAVALFRSYYSGTIVPALKGTDVITTHEFKKLEGALPGPATMTNELSDFALSQGHEVEFAIVSEYPFPWRADRQLNDFQLRALTALRADKKEFYEVVETDNGKVFKYADPVVLGESCVNCHNQHPDTPKNDWKAGDIRGIQEITLPFGYQNFLVSWRLLTLIALVAIMIAFSFCTIVFLFRFLKQNNQALALTEQKSEQLEASYRELKRSKEVADAAIQAKSRFFAVMSHEIRTPLNGVVGMINLLEDDNLSPQQKQDIGAIKKCSGSLVHIINDILDYSKIEAEKMPLNSTAFNPKELVDTCVQLFTRSAQSKGIEITVETEPGLVTWLIGDESKIRQILFNLIGNAVKFTLEGGVKVLLSGSRGEGHAYELRIQVKDTGIGIAQQNIQKVFSAFEQEDRGDSRKFGGTGLGLSISQKLAGLMGGKIYCKSESGKGSEFGFSLKMLVADSTPQANSDSAAGASESETKPNQSSGAKKDQKSAPRYNKPILLVEDNQVNQQVATRMLARMGYESELAKDGQEAVDLWTKNRHEIILMDIQMPRKDGYEATSEIRKLSSNNISPIIIALTANAGESDRRESIEKGMNDFLSKPFKEEKLRDKLLYWCSKIQTPAKNAVVEDQPDEALELTQSQA